MGFRRTPAQVEHAECPNYKPGGFNSAYCAAFAEPTSTALRHPSWEDPAAVLIAIGGIAIAVGIVLTGRKAR